MAVTAIFKNASNEVITGLTFRVNGDTGSEAAWQEVRIFAPAGKVFDNGLTLDGSGTSDAKVQLATDTGSPAAYGASLDVAGPITASSYATIHVRAKATAGETAANDVSVTLSVTAGEAVAA